MLHSFIHPFARLPQTRTVANKNSQIRSIPQDFGLGPLCHGFRAFPRRSYHIGVPTFAVPIPSVPTKTDFSHDLGHMGAQKWANAIGVI